MQSGGSSRHVSRDGADWRLGATSDVDWITLGTSIDRTIQSSTPLVFDAYATIVLPEDEVERELHDRAIVGVLADGVPDQMWWLGYLDTGSDDVVFPGAHRVTVYADWSYVLVRAGPEQAINWRARRSGCRSLPDLIFPADRSWLVSRLWDDDWTCVGGPAALVEGFVHHPHLACRARRVSPGEDATPPGHVSI